MMPDTKVVTMWVTRDTDGNFATTEGSRLARPLLEVPAGDASLTIYLKTIFQSPYP